MADMRDGIYEHLHATLREKDAEIERLRTWQKEQVVLIDDTAKLITELQTEKTAAETALAEARAAVERYKALYQDLRADYEPVELESRHE